LVVAETSEQKKNLFHENPIVKKYGKLFFEKGKKDAERVMSWYGAWGTDNKNWGKK